MARAAELTVTVKVDGPLAQEGVPRRAELRVPPGATVLDVLARAGIDARQPWNAALDGALAGAADRVADGSVLIVFAPIEGG